jgi:hypothetical protein
MADEVSGITVPPSVLAPKPTTAQELPAHGELAAAPVIPAKGPAGLEAGSPAVVVVQRLKDSPTIKAARVMIWTGLSAGIAIIGGAVLAHGGVIGLDWKPVLNAAINAAVLAVAGMVMGRMKRKDNNPVE